MIERSGHTTWVADPEKSSRNSPCSFEALESSELAVVGRVKEDF